MNIPQSTLVTRIATASSASEQAETAPRQPAPARASKPSSESQSQVFSSMLAAKGLPGIGHRPAIDAASKFKANDSAAARRDAMQAKVKSMEDELKELQKELDEANDSSGFGSFVSGLFGDDAGASDVGSQVKRTDSVTEATARRSHAFWPYP